MGENMRLRPTEVKAVAELLSEPADDEMELAEMIVRRINEMRAKRTDYAVIMNDNGMVSTWGPFDTEGDAKKAIGKTIVASKAGATGRITPLLKG